MSEQHHELGASGAYRYLACPGSVAAQRGKPNESSIYADEGTEAHELAELTLLTWQGDNTAINRTETWSKRVAEKGYDRKEMLRETDKYVNYVRDLCEDDSTRLRVEQRVSLDPAIPGGFSTADAVIVRKDANGSVNRIYVVDLKYGKGKQVSAIDNPQLKLYGYGVINALIADGILDDLLDDFAVIPIELHICQSRLDHFESQMMSLQRLLDWVEEDVRPAIDKILEGDETRNAGTHCDFCRAAPTCRARAEQVAAELNDDFDDFLEEGVNLDKPANLTPEEISKILDHKSDIEKYFETLKKFAYAEIEAGREIPDWKLVAGNKNRKWVSEDEAMEAFKGQRALKMDEYAPRKLVSPAQADKILPEKSKIRELIVEGNNAPMLVKSSHKKPALEFAPVTDLMDDDEDTDDDLLD